MLAPGEPCAGVGADGAVSPRTTGGRISVLVTPGAFSACAA